MISVLDNFIFKGDITTIRDRRDCADRLAISDPLPFRFLRHRDALGHLQFGALTGQNRKILAPIELERLSGTERQ